MRMSGRLALLGLSVCAVPALAADITVVNSGFEVPNLNGGYAYAGPFPDPNVPTFDPNTPGIGFTFSNPGGSAIAANGSAFNVTGATGSQAGVLQGGNGTLTGPGASFITQDLTGFETGSASVTFSLERRQNQINPVLVTLDGVPLGTFTPESGGSFNTVTTSAVPVVAGETYTLAFIGTAGSTGDVSSFIDNISVTNTPIPEPASLSPLALGGLGLLARRRR